MNEPKEQRQSAENDRGPQCRSLMAYTLNGEDLGLYMRCTKPPNHVGQHRNPKGAKWRDEREAGVIIESAEL